MQGNGASVYRQEMFFMISRGMTYQRPFSSFYPSTRSPEKLETWTVDEFNKKFLIDDHNLFDLFSMVFRPYIFAFDLSERLSQFGAKQKHI